MHLPPIAGDALVVDEGPGLSGSSLLGAAEAAARAGAERVAILCSHEPDPTKLCAPRAEARWRAQRVRVVPEGVRTPPFSIDLSGGEWRRHVYPDEASWPACWPATERRKGLSRERRLLLKFEGLGAVGRAARARGDALAGAGFTALTTDAGDGYASRPWLTGRPARRNDARDALLRTLAAYCAARPRLCAAREVSELGPVVARNVELACGRSWRHSLEVERPAIVDGRMMPHEWLLLPEGRFVKTDATTHGDDHFFPGPTDVAWDLAGAIVEWELDEPSRDAFLGAYAAQCRDDPRGRLGAWLVAYSSFRVAFTSTALDSSRGSPEEPRLTRDLARYLAALRAAL